MVAKLLLWYLGWLLWCCYAVAKAPGWLLGCCYVVASLPGLLLRCYYAVARVAIEVVKV